MSAETSQPILLVRTGRLTWHTAAVGTCVWARKSRRGGWMPAVIEMLGRHSCKVVFDGGLRRRHRYEEMFLRNPKKNFVDRPARCQVP